MRAILLALLLVGCSGESATPSPVRGPFVAIDGDTLAAGSERYRLERIDAPEMPGHCRPGRRCVEGDPYRSQAYLQGWVDRGAFCYGTRRDAYRRLLVTCWATGYGIGRSINDIMVLNGYAEPYVYRGNR